MQQSEFSTPEQMAATVARMFFSITTQWGITDAMVAKLLNVSHLKVASFKRFSAYFTQEQMIIAGQLLSIYNDLTLILNEKVGDKGKRTGNWINNFVLEDGKRPRTLLLNPSDLGKLREIVQSLKNKS